MGRACGGASNDGHAMSLILEALRRSEAERRRAALPTLLGESAAARPVRPPREPVQLKGQFFLAHWALPNFYFHVTTAYALLRQAGVELGKGDYLAVG